MIGAILSIVVFAAGQEGNSENLFAFATQISAPMLLLSLAIFVLDKRRSGNLTAELVGGPNYEQSEVARPPPALRLLLFQLIVARNNLATLYFCYA